MRIGECLRKLHYFAAVLCYSRLLYVEFLSQSMECFLAANRRALEYYGASPRRAMHDNLKTAVLERLPGYAPVFNPRYLDFAAHYGFKPVACNVGRSMSFRFSCRTSPARIPSRAIMRMMQASREQPAVGRLQI